MPELLEPVSNEIKKLLRLQLILSFGLGTGNLKFEIIFGKL